MTARASTRWAWGLVIAALIALPAHAQDATPPQTAAQTSPPPQASTPEALSPEASAALDALVAHAPKALRLVVETKANEKGQPERREITLTSDQRLAMRTFIATTPTDVSAAVVWPATPELFTYVDDAHVRFTSKTGEGNRFAELPKNEYWGRGDLPVVVRMAVLPLIPEIVRAMRADPQLLVSAESSQSVLWTATSPATRTQLRWNSDSGELLSHTLLMQGVPASSFEFKYDNQGTIAAIHEISLPPPATSPPDSLLTNPPLSTPGVNPPVTWMIREIRTDWPDPNMLEEALRFDQRAMGLVKWDTNTGELTDADGKVVGIDKVPAVAAMDAFFKQKQQEETKKMRENPHGIPMAKWIWWLAGAAALCVVVDQIRRRL